MGRNQYTNLLFSQPSLTEELGRAIDIGGNFDDYNYSASGEEADRIAIASDWYAVGADLYRVMSRYITRPRNQPPHGRRTASR